MNDKMKQDMMKKGEEQMKRYNENMSKKKELDSAFIFSTYFPPVDLEPKKSGEYEIKRTILKPGREMTVVSMRNYLMMGYRPLKIKLDCDRALHELIRKGQGLMMSDSPQEMFLQYDMYKRAKGKVLVGGLGLGMYARMIEKKDEVTEIVVVEISQDVINISTPKKSKKIRIIKDDITNFLKTTEEKFDYIYIDTYYGTGASEYLNTVAPLRKILKERFPDTGADFWAEEEMKSQL